ncbi:hypothetical protein [Leptothoe kymatousa]|uniref:Prenyltransferase n=1 Tax=Leptothoe kymatousa TAU-MAC 1615 TaxID=2364775 RepID=A0ABS5Y4Y8_9CYAN|nr:hypothetical protein [Leptothoe kymatousa]MBT9312691.1 hypothetical protein [Leptothoe kymatousa TAU-MAC 1615]
MAILSAQDLQRAKTLIFEKGRLLERTLYGYMFESGDRNLCLKALLAYQNADGGFGNGLEPDVLCPASTPIGAESALFVLDMLDYDAPEVIGPLLGWLEAHQLESGEIDYPPATLADYPHQPWWNKPDCDRILVLASLLSQWQPERPNLFAKAQQYYEQSGPGEAFSFYSYPVFAYLARCGLDEKTFQGMVQQLPSILQENADHFPLFGRYWYHLKDFVAQDVLDQAAESVAMAIREDGGIVRLYVDLPWWQSIFTLDSLMLLKRSAYL